MAKVRRCELRAMRGIVAVVLDEACHLDKLIPQVGPASGQITAPDRFGVQAVHEGRVETSTGVIRGHGARVVPVRAVEIRSTADEVVASLSEAPGSGFLPG